MRPPVPPLDPHPVHLPVSDQFGRVTTFLSPAMFNDQSENWKDFIWLYAHICISFIDSATCVVGCHPLWDIKKAMDTCPNGDGFHPRRPQVAFQLWFLLFSWPWRLSWKCWSATGTSASKRNSVKIIYNFTVFYNQNASLVSLVVGVSLKSETYL